MDETARTLGISCGTLLLDLAEFYDSISIPVLVRHALAQKFPAIVLRMELHLSLAPRFLKERKWLSREILPWRSLVAGSPHGAQLAKAFLGPLLHQAQLNYQARIGLWTYVDDTAVRSQGTVAVTDRRIRAGDQ